MKTKFQLLMTAAAMSTCIAHAAGSVDPLGPLPGESLTTKAVPLTPASAPVKAAPRPTPANAPPVESTSATLSAPLAAEPAAAPSFAAKPPATTPAPVTAPLDLSTTSAEAQPKIATLAQVPVQIVVPAPDRTYTRTTNATFLEMDRLRSENAVLAEKVRQKELMDKLNPPTVIAPAAATPVLNSVTPGNTGMSTGANIRPNMVLSIYGIEDDLTAVLSTTGAPLKVKVGSQVPGIGKVKTISREGVTVSTKKSTVALEMAPISAYPGAR